jgi:four helix bundle protein
MEDGKRQSGTLRSFRDLGVYKLARVEARKIFLLSKGFPREERYSLTDQVRRSSRAVGSMIAEAWARRRYEAAFVAKLNEALGEAMETQSWLDAAFDCEYIDGEQHVRHDAGWQSVGAMLSRMMERSATFCQTAYR